MEEYIGRINVQKDTMLFVINSVFNKGIKESTTKENILKMMPEIYEEVQEKEILKLIPYETYITLMNLVKFIEVEKSNDIKKFLHETEYKDVRYLEETMVIIMRANHGKYNYSLNPGVIEKLEKIFSEENRKIAERYGKIEQIVKGILYTYGVVEIEFLRKTVSKYMKEIIMQKELEDIFFKRLSFNLLIDYCNIKWANNNTTNLFVTYLNEENDVVNVADIAEEQKERGLQYKKYSDKELLERKEYLWNESCDKLYQFIESKNQDIREFTFQTIIKRNELGENVLGELADKCLFEDEDEKEIEEFMELFMEWYNNSPQYQLCGYSPNEFRSTMK